MFQVGNDNYDSLFEAFLQQITNVPPNNQARHLHHQLAVYMFSNRDSISISVITSFICPLFYRNTCHFKPKMNQCIYVLKCLSIKQEDLRNLLIKSEKSYKEIVEEIGECNAPYDFQITAYGFERFSGDFNIPLPAKVGSKGHQDKAKELEHRTLVPQY